VSSPAPGIETLVDVGEAEQASPQLTASRVLKLTWLGIKVWACSRCGGPPPGSRQGDNLSRHPDPPDAAPHDGGADPRNKVWNQGLEPRSIRTGPRPNPQENSSVRLVKVFISWSGTKSRDVALALREWLPLVMNSVEPFVSAKDIYAGTRWQLEISAQLEATNFGIVCVTRVP